MLIGRSEIFGGRTQKRYPDPGLVQKSAFVLEYLAQLRSVGLEPLFKGGSAVQLLLRGNVRRLSIDLDLAHAELDEIEAALYKVAGKFDSRYFVAKNIPDRKPMPGGRVARYEVSIPSPVKAAVSSILLEVFPIVPKYQIETRMIATSYYDSDVMVRVPTHQSMLGDKLGTLASPSIGVPFPDPEIMASSDLPASMLRLYKHFYDTTQLFAACENSFGDALQGFECSIEAQNKYRGKSYSFDECMDDLTDTLKVFLIGGAQRDNVPDAAVRRKSAALDDGLNLLNNYLPSEVRGRLRPSWRQENAAAALFCTKIMVLKHSKELRSAAEKALYGKLEAAVEKWGKDETTLRKMIEELKEEADPWIAPEGLFLTAPKGLVYWYGYKKPFEFMEKLEAFE